MIKGIAHICIAATDLAATRRFYCDALGFRRVFDFIRGGEVIGFYIEVAKGNYIEAFRQDAVDSQGRFPISHVCFEVDDIDAVSRRIQSAGYAVTEKKLGADRSWQAWTADPSGVRIEFHQYTKESSQVTGRDCVLE